MQFTSAFCLLVCPGESREQTDPTPAPCILLRAYCMYCMYRNTLRSTHWMAVADHCATERPDDVSYRFWPARGPEDCQPPLFPSNPLRTLACAFIMCFSISCFFLLQGFIACSIEVFGWCCPPCALCSSAILSALHNTNLLLPNQTEFCFFWE
jgi:hypothetical protein